jgi:beta-lactamase class C
MKKLFSTVQLSISLLCLVMTIPAWAETDANKAKLDQEMTTFMQQNGIPGAAIAVYEQGVTHTYTYGVANKITQKPITTNTLFEVGSITKLLTTLLIAEGAGPVVPQQESKTVPASFNLGNTVPRYLPAYSQNPAFSQVTLLELATYSAGLPFNLPNDITTNGQIITYLNKWVPPYPVGSQWQYSNMSIGALGAVLQSQYHQPIAMVYQKMIFHPLQMYSSGLLLSAQEKMKLAQGYSDLGEPVSPTLHMLFPSAGALKSDITDMSHFLRAAVDGSNCNFDIKRGMEIAQTPRAVLPDGVMQGMAWQLTSLNDPQLMQSPQNMNFGPLPLTWLPPEKQQFDPHWLIDKTGATDGFRAYIAVIPAQQKGVVILVNRYVTNGVIVNFGRQLLMQQSSPALLTSTT